MLKKKKKAVNAYFWFEDGSTLEVEGEIEVKERDEYSQATWTPITSQSANKGPHNVSIGPNQQD